MSRSLKMAALALTVAVGGCHKEPGETAQPQASASTTATHPPAGVLDRSHKGEAIPDLTLTDAAGKSAKLATFAGKPLLVNLWATWCAPCVVELPTLDRLAQDRSGSLKVVAVSQDMTGTEKVAGFLAGKGATHLEPWLDPKNDLAFRYEASTLPTTILYDAAGKEVWRYVGGHDWTGADAAKLIAEAG